MLDKLHHLRIQASDNRIHLAMEGLKCLVHVTNFHSFILGSLSSLFLFIILIIMGLKLLLESIDFSQKLSNLSVKALDLLLIALNDLHLISQCG